MSESKLSAEEQISQMNEMLKENGYNEKGIKVQQEQTKNTDSNFNTTETETKETTEESFESTETTSEESDLEKQARSLGWKSKEEREAEGKNNNHYVSPEEYIKRQPLFDRIEKQNNEIRELRDLIKQTTNHLSDIKANTYAQSIADLESKQYAAVSDGDTQKFTAVNNELNVLRQKIANDNLLRMKEEQTTPTKPPEVVDWESKNSHWYNNTSPENLEMANVAVFIDKFFANRAAQQGSKLNLTEHLRQVEAEVRRLYPHRFPNEKQQKPMSVGKSTSTAKTEIDDGLVSMLTPAQRQLGESFQKWNPKYSLKEYASDLKKSGRLGKK